MTVSTDATPTSSALQRPPRRSPAIRARGLVRAFPGTLALDHVDLDVDDGTLVALVGPSGSGKTTLLRSLAGFEVPDAGTVEIGGRRVLDDGVFVEPEHRGIGMVFQDGALFPHLTVGANAAFGDATPDRVAACLELVGLADRAGDYPHELSGGERQRVALARALAPEPAVVLLDEPFASLDRERRETLREQVVAILAQAGATAVLVTHDQDDALAVADRVVVLHDGRVEQVGTPEDVYRRPATAWVADFLGDADVLPGSASGGVVTCALGRLPGDPGLRGEVAVVVRPEMVAIRRPGSAPHAAGERGLAASVLRRRFFGHDQMLWLRLASGEVVRCRRSDGSVWRPGDAVEVEVEGPVHVLAAPDPATRRAAPDPR